MGCRAFHPLEARVGSFQLVPFGFQPRCCMNVHHTLDKLSVCFSFLPSTAAVQCPFAFHLSPPAFHLRFHLASAYGISGASRFHRLTTGCVTDVRLLKQRSLAASDPTE